MKYLQPLSTDTEGYLLATAKRNCGPGNQLTMQYNNVKTLEMCKRAVEDLGPEYSRLRYSSTCSHIIPAALLFYYCMLAGWARGKELSARVD